MNKYSNSILLFSLSIIPIYFIYFTYMSYCIKYVIWNEVIFICLLHCLSMSVLNHMLKYNKKDILLSDNDNLSKFTIYFCISLSLYVLSNVMIFLNITKLINC